MNKKYRAVHFINQFFAQIGGEEMADTSFSVSPQVIGPGLAFQRALGGEYEIIATMICGDNYFTDHTEEVLCAITQELRRLHPDVVIAGPAFNAGRYGPNCGAVCKVAQEQLGIPSVTGMYEENPGVAMFRKDCYIVQTQNSAVGMRSAVPAMANLVKKLMDGKEAPAPETDGYFAKGLKRNVFVSENGADRALDMLLAKVTGHPYQTELTMPAFEVVAPAPPVADISKARIALVTDAGVTDKENTQRLESARASKYLSLNIAGMDRLSTADFCSVHGGFDTTIANRNPNVLVPLDILRHLVKDGKIGSVLDTLYSTTGNGTSLKNAQHFGEEIARQLVSQHVDAVILSST